MTDILYSRVCVLCTQRGIGAIETSPISLYVQLDHKIQLSVFGCLMYLEI
jgi:hypothetical protein